MSRSVKYDDMTEDYFIKKAKDNKTVGYVKKEMNNAVFKITVIAFAVVFSVLLSMFNPFLWMFFLGNLFKDKIDKFNAGKVLNFFKWLSLVVMIVLFLFLILYSKEKGINWWDEIGDVFKNTYKYEGYQMFQISFGLGLFSTPITSILLALSSLIFRKSIARRFGAEEALSNQSVEENNY